MAHKVMTVLGEVDPDDLGTTLAHEHLIADFRPMIGTATYGYDVGSDEPLTRESAADVRFAPGSILDNYNLHDVDLAVEELAPFAELGGRTVVECTPIPFRDPAKLRTIAERTGLHIVMGGSYYIEPGHPEGLAQRSLSDIEQELVDEFAHGFGVTGVRPGMIGEVGTSATITAAEEKVLRASARAARRTGLPLTVHVHPWGKQGVRVCDLIAEEGLAPDRVILNHIGIDHDDDAYQQELFGRGVYCAYDLFGFDHSLFKLGRYPPNDHEVGLTVVRHLAEGRAGQLIISQDVAVKSRLRAFGSWGYVHILKHIVPMLHSQGATDEHIDQLLVANPRRVLTLADPEDLT